jgi:hypothetical protein
MILAQHNNWEETTNFTSGDDVRDSHIVVNSIPDGYSDISSIENWNKYGLDLIGSAVGFKDWKCLQREIKALALTIVAGNFDSGWDNLNPDQKLIVCTYCLASIPPARFASTVTDANERMQMAITFDLNNRRARGNWQAGVGRIQIMRIYLFSKIGKADALEVLNNVVADGLLELYEGGVAGTEEDGIVGLNDFLLSRPATPYETSGLTTRDYAVIDGSSDTMTDIANALVAIANNGLY